MSYRIGNDSEIYRINISDHILDNIYGHIGITEVEKQANGRLQPHKEFPELF